MQSIPQQGQIVDVRHRKYAVADCRATAVPPSAADLISNGRQHVVTLTSLEDDALGEELQVVWELEPGATIHDRTSLPRPVGFDPPHSLDAFLNAVRWGASSTADTRSIQSPFRSGIEIEDYQLDPVVRAVQMPRVNLLVADDVGLGKTIEAGLVALELIVRHRTRRILIACPASLQIQWQDQMHDKFGLEFRIVDADLMKQLRRSRGLQANPWTHFPRLITSIDFLKRDRPLRLFREVLGNVPTYPRKFDLLIVDEAHNVAPSGRGRYATDSMRTSAMRELVPHFEHKLFLSATPHNGYVESFSALLELLDNQRFMRGVPPDRDQLAAVMVRRLKSDFQDWDGSNRFKKRCLEALQVSYTEAEREAHQLLRDYAQSRQSNAADNSEKFATEFVLKLLKKRLFSSPAAFASTLAKHRESIRSSRRRKANRRPPIGILRREVDKVEEEYADDNAFEEATHEAVDSASRLFREPSAEEEQALDRLGDWAARSAQRGDSKVAALIDFLKVTLQTGGQWNNERVIIFTEYRTTQNWLLEQLASHGLGGDRLETLYGGMTSDERERVKAAFQYDPVQSPVRILLATDAASEGIDLQNHCHRIVHYEIPWNPNRMEQRNGRVDRHGQKHDVEIFHFVGKGFKAASDQGRAKPGELEADLEFLMRAALKVNTIREDLGKVGPVIAEQVQEAMLGHRTELNTSRAETEAGSVRRTLKFERNLHQQVVRLKERLDESKRELHLSPENVQAVVETALKLTAKPALIPGEAPGLWPDPTGKRKNCPVFDLPAFSGSWARCATGLTHPHTGQIRPIVFDHDLARGRDDVVLAHVNHRLVQMCLGVLRAEIWAPEASRKINRVAARVATDLVLDAPALIAHARLVVIGGDSHRLHEEVISAGGYLREGRFTRLNVGQTNDALAAATDDEPSDAVKRRLEKVWDDVESQLTTALEARMRDRVASLEKSLAEREAKEVADITTIMLELKRTIEVELNDAGPEQLELFSSEERTQFERNRDALAARAAAIPAEIEKETAAIRARFAAPQPRWFPAAVEFIVPRKLAG